MNVSFAKKRFAFRAAVAAALVLLIVAMSAVCLSACNDDDGPDPAAERAEAVNALKVNTLAALDAKWTPGLTDAEIIRLARPGGYIEATLWTEMLADVVFASRLQTGKIRTAADFIASEEGRELFADAAGNLDSALELIDALGLTTEDVSELGFDLLCAVVSEMRALYIETADRLNAIDEKGVMGDANTDLTAAIERAERIVASFGEDESAAAESVAQTLEALADAEEGIKTVLAFAYDTERIFGTGESGEGLAGLIGSAAEGEGALANVSEREMFAWLDGVLAGFEEFGKSMTAEKIASVKAALASVRECFQGFAQPVEVVRDAMEWLRGAEELLGEVPFLTGAIAAATDVIYERGEDGGYTYDFVRRLKLLAEEDGTLADINSYILAGEAILSFAEVYDAQAVKDELKRLAENGGEMTSLVIYAMALMFEASEQEGEDIEFTDDIAALAVALLTEVMGSATETAWNNYVSDPEKYQNRLRIFSGMVLSFAEVLNENIAAHGGTRVDINVTSDGPYTAEWYAEVVRIRRETIERAGTFTEGDALSSVAVGIIGEYVDKCYASLPDIERAVSAGWVEDAESEEAKLVTEMAANNPIFMLLAMFM